uniref:Uncharacterized protein n=1 Tax=Helianthus annuus TaxID=4232 RepID=A0A251SJY5_HELAN
MLPLCITLTVSNTCRYADESGMIKYVKIASTLRNKTVRDVAIRCRWMACFTNMRNLADKTKETRGTEFVEEVKRYEALQSSMRHLLEQNNRVLGQISTNIHTLKLQDNFDLFRQTKNNITAILNDMRCMPGPPVPVSLNEDLANAILSIKTQTMMFSSSGGMNMKQEPGYW